MTHETIDVPADESQQTNLVANGMAVISIQRALHDAICCGNKRVSLNSHISSPNIAPYKDTKILRCQDDDGIYGVYARSLRTDLGTGIEVRYYPCYKHVQEPRFILVIVVRQPNGKYQPESKTIDFDEASAAVALILGAPPKGRTKKKIDKTAAARMKWRKPLGGRIRMDGSKAIRGNILRVAHSHGFCRVDVDNARVYKDVESPELEEHLYFLIEVKDYSHRSFLVLLNEKADEFMVAIQHNQNVIKLTADDKLFVTGNNPLDVTTLNEDDMELIRAAIGTIG